MDNPNPEKVKTVEQIADKLSTAGSVVVTDYRGIAVAEQGELRAAIRKAGGEYKIYKNTLARIAAEKAGVDIAEHLVGPTALAFVYPGDDGSPADPVGLSKALVEFSKNQPNLVIKGGFVDGSAVAAADVEALSKIPPRDQMLANFAALLQAPMAKMAGLLQAMPRDFAGLLKALIDKGGAGEAEDDQHRSSPANSADSDDENSPVKTDEAAEATDEPDEAAVDSAKEMED